MPRRRMIDMLMSRHHREPYGYPDDYARGRRMRPMRHSGSRMGEDYNYSHEMRDPYSRHGYEHDGGTRYPFMVEGEIGRYDGHYYPPYYGDMRYDYAGDYGEKLSREELEHWNKKMLKDVDDKYKHFFTKENVAQKARTLNVQMEGFNEDELLTSTIAMYTDYCEALKPYIGENMDAYIRMGKAFLMDKDASVKGGEKLAVYYDCIVEGEDE